MELKFALFFRYYIRYCCCKYFKEYTHIVSYLCEANKIYYHNVFINLVAEFCLQFSTILIVTLLLILKS